MRIDRITIKNFRGIKKGAISFDNHTVLVGPNNAGKTSVIEALAVLFGRDRLVRNLTEHDFYGASPASADRFYIMAIITDFSGNNPDHHSEWFRMGRGILKWINPADQSIGSTKQSEHYKLCVEIGVAGRFDHEDLIVELRRYFVDSVNSGDPFDEEYAEQFPSSLLKDSGFFLVPASRTWDKMISFSSELFRRVVSTVGSVPAQAIMAQRNELRTPTVKLEEQPELQSIFSDIDKELALLFNKAPKSLLRLTATNSEAILATLIPHFDQTGGAIPPIPSIRQGSGIVSMQNLLLLLQLGKLRKKHNQSFFVAIEEPELHIPPCQQRRLTNRLKSCCEQTIVTTHSPIVAAEFDPHSIRILDNNSGELSARPLIQKPLVSDEVSAVRQLIQWQRSDAINALMHERLLIPEGKTDCNWLKHLVTGLEVYQDSLTGNGYIFGALIGVFPTDSAAVEKVSEVMAKAHPNVFCLVDGDPAGRTYITSLQALVQKPKLIVKWPDNWTIENVIGSLLKADETTFLEKIRSLINNPSLASVDAFTALLKQPYSQGGRKDDYLLHGELSRLLFTTQPGRDAVSAFMSALVDVTSANPAASTKFMRSPLSTELLEVMEYQP